MGKKYVSWKMPAMALALAVTQTQLSGCVPVVVGAAATTGVLVATDRRTTGSQLDDTSTSTAISVKVANKYGDNVHVNVTSYNGIILLTGEVPDQATSDAVTKTAQSEERVRAVQNELLIGKPSELSSRTNDTYLTSKVKTRFVDSSFSPTHVKVVSERGIVYLMGVVKHSEGKEASDIARKTDGVKRVVTIFEYTDKS